MMKPDTPKFAGPCCTHKRVAAFTEEKNGVVFREYWACEDCRKEFMPGSLNPVPYKCLPYGADDDDDLDIPEHLRGTIEERDALRAATVKPVLAAAPKPDCVGVEEAKRELGKALLAKWRGDATFGEIVQDIVDEIADRGLLAVKEKAQEKAEKQCP